MSEMRKKCSHNWHYIPIQDYKRPWSYIMDIVLGKCRFCDRYIYLNVHIDRHPPENEGIFLGQLIISKRSKRFSLEEIHSEVMRFSTIEDITHYCRLWQAF